MEEKQIKKHLDFSAEVRCFKTIDSTNNEAKRLVSQGKAGTLLLIADEQTSGRGRLGRSFYSPQSTGIYMTLAISPYRMLSSALSVTSAAAAAVCIALEELTPLKPQIKWVNDICIDGKKVCGILTETVSCGEESALIIGIGINITTKDFPPEVENGGSLGVQLDKARLAAEIFNLLMRFIDGEPTEYIDYCRKHSTVIGKNISIIKNGTAVPARALGIDSNGGLRVRLEDGQEKTLISGEVSIRQRED